MMLQIIKIFIFCYTFFMREDVLIEKIRGFEIKFQTRPGVFPIRD